MLRSVTMDTAALPWGLSLCQKAFRKEWHRKKVTAAYIEGGTIIIDSNCNKTHPMGFKYQSRSSRIHAELAVLRHIKDASRGVLYIYRETFAGELALARPCSSCMGILLEKGVRSIVYSTTSGYAKEKILTKTY